MVPIVTWPAAFLVLAVSHVAGDFLLQTDWQALNKVRGLSDPLGRAALLRHLATYTAAFVPALVWIGIEEDALRAVLVGLVVAIPHGLVDDGRFLAAWMRRVKHAEDPSLVLRILVDQSFHVLCLFGAALVAVA
jgi:hypothetical protein